MEAELELLGLLWYSFDRLRENIFARYSLNSSNLDAIMICLFNFLLRDSWNLTQKVVIGLQPRSCVL